MRFKMFAVVVTLVLVSCSGCAGLDRAPRTTAPLQGDRSAQGGRRVNTGALTPYQLLRLQDNERAGSPQDSTPRFDW